MIDQRLEQHRGAGFVNRSVALDRVHRLPHADLGRQMDDAVDVLQRTGDDVLVADVADDEFRVLGKVLWPITIAVDLLDQAVENPHPIAAAKKLVDDGATDKSSPASD